MSSREFNYLINFTVKENLLQWILFFVMIRVGGALSRDTAVQQAVLPALERRLRAWFGTGRAVRYFRWAVCAVEFVVMFKFLYSCTHAPVLSIGWLIAMLLWVVLYAAFELLCTAARNVQNKNAE